MITSNLYAALTSTIYVNAMTLNGKNITTDDQKIRASGLYSEWKAGAHTVGEIFNTYSTEDLNDEWNQTWECYQNYDNDVYPDIVPGNPAWYTFNRPLHGKSKETARPFVSVQGSHDIYHCGEYMIWTDGTIQKCIAPNGTNFSPADYPDGWEVA